MPSFVTPLIEAMNGHAWRRVIEGRPLLAACFDAGAAPLPPALPMNDISAWRATLARLVNILPTAKATYSRVRHDASHACHDEWPLPTSKIFLLRSSASALKICWRLSPIETRFLMASPRFSGIE